MIHLFYNFFFTFSLIFIAPFFLLKALVDRGRRRELMQRIGFIPDLSVQRPIWVHAASVGEVFCSVPLIKKIKRESPNCKIVLTTVTRTGNEAAKTHVPEADQVFFLPIDHPLVVRRFLGRVRPGLLLIAETELWPNLLRSCGKEKIPIILFNGRISQKAFRRYLLLKSFFGESLSNISLFLMQTEEDRVRIVEIGASFEKTMVVGNLKFDQSFPAIPRKTIDEMMNQFGFQGKETILIAGSTHSGEEEILLSSFKSLRKIDPDLVLFLAPRHLDRLGEVEKILMRESVSWVRWTSLSSSGDQPNEKRGGAFEVILLDTLGELMGLYSLGTLVFIGGSLVPVGGHNPLEPLFFRKCVLFGPHMFNFSEVSRSLTETGGAIQVKGREDLLIHLEQLLSNEEERRKMGERGYQFLQHHQGATEKMFEEIRPFLSGMQNAECGLRIET